MDKSCWWIEGGRCYADPNDRGTGKPSEKECQGRCDNYKSKRSVWMQVFSDDDLILVSEENEKRK